MASWRAVVRVSRPEDVFGLGQPAPALGASSFVEARFEAFPRAIRLLVDSVPPAGALLPPFLFWGGGSPTKICVWCAF